MKTLITLAFATLIIIGESARKKNLHPPATPKTAAFSTPSHWHPLYLHKQYKSQYKTDNIGKLTKADAG